MWRALQANGFFGCDQTPLHSDHVPTKAINGVEKKSWEEWEEEGENERGA